MNPAVIAAVAVGAILLLGRSSSASRAARDLSEEDAIAVLRANGVEVSPVVRDENRFLIRVPSRLGGVVYRYMGKDRGTEVMNPRLAVLLYRLGRALEARGVVFVDHLGVYPGKSDDALTMHNRGFAADLAGFVFSDASQLTVLNDWTRARSFFRTVYDVLCAEAECKTLVGEGDYLITPDHHDAKLAAAHKDHFHVQIDHTRSWNPLVSPKPQDSRSYATPIPEDEP